MITNIRIKDIRQNIIDKINDYTLEQLFADKDIQRFISPAWKNGSSKEDMILRKMQNNATKKYPKNFENAFISEAYESTFEDYDQYKKKDLGESYDFTEENNAPEKLENELENETNTVEIKSVLDTGEVVEVEKVDDTYNENNNNDLDDFDDVGF